MKRFRFRLERVLDYRNAVKKEKERELALRSHELTSAEETLEDILREQEGCGVEEGVQTMADLSLNAHYQERLQEMLIQQRVLVLEAAEAVESARGAYLEKAVEAEVLDRFREKRRAEFKEEKKRNERRELDNTAIVRHRRGRER